MSKLEEKAGSLAVLAVALVVNLGLWLAILAATAWLADAATTVVAAGLAATFS